MLSRAPGAATAGPGIPMRGARGKGDQKALKQWSSGRVDHIDPDEIPGQQAQQGGGISDHQRSCRSSNR